MTALLFLAALATLQPHATAPVACPPAPDALRLVLPSSLREATVHLARCVQADLDAGRWSDARARLDRAAAAGLSLDGVERREWAALIARLDATLQVDAGEWTTQMGAAVLHEDALPWVGPLVRGVAAARTSWARQDAVPLGVARSHLEHLEALARAAGVVSEEERARLLVQAAIAGAQYERDEMQLLLEAAHELEGRLFDEGVRAPVMRARELEADLLRVTDRYAAAAERYRALLADHPRRVQARIGLADAYRRLGYMHEAEETLAQARTLWKGADTEALALLR